MGWLSALVRAEAGVPSGSRKRDDVGSLVPAGQGSGAGVMVGGLIWGSWGLPAKGRCRSRHVRPACSPALPRAVAGPVPEGPSARQRSSANGTVVAREQSSDGRAPGAGAVVQGLGAGLVWWLLEWVERRETQGPRVTDLCPDRCWERTARSPCKHITVSVAQALSCDI